MFQLGVGKMRQGMINGDVEGGTLLAGQISGMIKDIKSVKSIIDGIMAEAETTIKMLNNYTKDN